ncbi:hypothetical protein CL689_00665 [Candidatus Saccharibacteria bacterium]|nr:hypothetical protein [Candidatus Saccharibacteria bacterium]|tara:strand:+ start:819 stop:1139 length:321 start_codon:yes stop_codon:yes gene_type:complete
MRKQAPALDLPKIIARWSLAAMMLYTLFYVLFGITVRFDIYERGLTFLVMVPIILASIGIAYGMLGNQVKQPVKALPATILLGLIISLMTCVLFYVIDAVVVSARY